MPPCSPSSRVAKAASIARYTPHKSCSVPITHYPLSGARSVQPHQPGPALARPPTIMAERYVVLAVVRRCAWYLKYASSDLRADREVVMAAVTKSGHALKYASDALRADREVVLAAIEHDSSHLKFASDELRCRIVSCWLWSSIVPQCSNIRSMLQHVPDELQADVQVAYR